MNNEQRAREIRKTANAVQEQIDQARRILTNAEDRITDIVHDSGQIEVNDQPTQSTEENQSMTNEQHVRNMTDQALSDGLRSIAREHYKAHSETTRNIDLIQEAAHRLSICEPTTEWQRNPELRYDPESGLHVIVGKCIKAAYEPETDMTEYLIKADNERTYRISMHPGVNDDIVQDHAKAPEVGRRCIVHAEQLYKVTSDPVTYAGYSENSSVPKDAAEEAKLVTLYSEPAAHPDIVHAQADESGNVLYSKA